MPMWKQKVGTGTQGSWDVWRHIRVNPSPEGDAMEGVNPLNPKGQL